MKVLILLALLAAPALCLADIYKCVDAQGNLSFADEPCPEQSNAPAPKPAAKVRGPATTAAGSGSKVRSYEPSNQDQRDLRSAYLQHHAAIAEKNWGIYLKSISAQRRTQMEGFGEKSLTALNAIEPTEVEIVADEITNNAATLKVKGKSPSMVAGSSADSYGTIQLRRENNVWKVDQQLWSNRAWENTAGPDTHEARKGACQGVSGNPESLAGHPMLKVAPREREISRLTLEPAHSSEIRFTAKSKQNVMFRVAYNEALRCQYGDPPAAMSIDGGKQWLHSYSGGLTLEPVNGKIVVTLKNTGKETLNLVLVASNPN